MGSRRNGCLQNKGRIPDAGFPTEAGVGAPFTGRLGGAQVARRKRGLRAALHLRGIDALSTFQGFIYPKNCQQELRNPGMSRFPNAIPTNNGFDHGFISWVRHGIRSR